MPKLLVFELDGGTWTIINPLIEKGRLPHLASLIRRGSKGTPCSTPPLTSPALWTTVYTGQPSEQHGVLSFDTTSQEVRCKRLWDIAHSYGISCGICGSMVTWPPYDVGGFMIPDMMARDAQTIPSQFAPLQKLIVEYPRGDKKLNYSLMEYARYAIGLRQAGIRPQTLLSLVSNVLTTKLLGRSRRDTYWQRALLLYHLYADAFVKLYRTYKPTLATYHYHAADTLSHWYWSQNGQAPGKQDVHDQTRYQHIVPSAYRVADRLLGRLLRAAGPDTTVLVISDHGFRSVSETWARYKVRLVRLIQILGLEEEATPTRMTDHHYLYFKTAAHVEKVGETLRSIHIKGSDKALLPRVVTRDRSLFFLPPIIHGEGLTVVIPSYGELPFEELFENLAQIATGKHDPEGIVILAGPAIKPGGKLKDPSLLDVTPTALAILGLPIARDMKGRVWKEALQPEFLEQHPISYVETYKSEDWETSSITLSDKDRQVLHQRLHDLGYL